MIPTTISELKPGDWALEYAVRTIAKRPGTENIHAFLYISRCDYFDERSLVGTLYKTTNDSWDSFVGNQSVVYFTKEQIRQGSKVFKLTEEEVIMHVALENI